MFSIYRQSLDIVSTKEDETGDGTGRIARRERIERTFVAVQGGKRFID